MWPVYGTEFETPVLIDGIFSDGKKDFFVFFILVNVFIKELDKFYSAL